MKFSERMGITEVKSEIQRESMDLALKNQLWNLVQLKFWDYSPHRSLTREDPLISSLNTIWDLFFEKPVDSIPRILGDAYYDLRQFFFSCQWNEVYDFIEFLVQQNLISGVVGRFNNSCNVVLKQQLSAYRFVGDNIAEITSGEEIGAIEDALKDSSAIRPVQEQLESALKSFSNREKPDYRNTIKESISAVESICKLITNDPKATLNRALDSLSKLLAEKDVPLHPALRSAFDKLYGYASDAGIRHGSIEESTVDFEEAKFILVACSAFVSYLLAKSQKAGINFEKG